METFLISLLILMALTKFMTFYILINLILIFESIRLVIIQQMVS